MAANPQECGSVQLMDGWWCGTVRDSQSEGEIGTFGFKHVGQVVTMSQKNRWIGGFTHGVWDDVFTRFRMSRMVNHCCQVISGGF